MAFSVCTSTPVKGSSSRITRPSCASGFGKVFPSVTYAISQTPTYPCGSLGFFLATKNGSAFPKAPIREVTPEFQAQLRYYTKELHTASFVLPYFAAKALDLHQQ